MENGKCFSHKCICFISEIKTEQGRGSDGVIQAEETSFHCTKQQVLCHISQTSWTIQPKQADSVLCLINTRCRNCAEAHFSREESPGKLFVWCVACTSWRFKASEVDALINGFQLHLWIWRRRCEWLLTHLYPVWWQLPPVFWQIWDCLGKENGTWLHRAPYDDIFCGRCSAECRPMKRSSLSGVSAKHQQKAELSLWP